MKYLLSILSLLFLMGCTDSSDIPKEQSALKDFLENRGYQVISYEGLAETYELTKEKITELPYIMYWGLQSVEPALYFSKTINVEKFLVKNHPLSKGEVDVYVYEVDGQPIGGTSFPHGEKLAGGFWSLDGKTLEELQTKSFQDWRTDWINKYSKNGLVQPN
ncbi:hypothetical protein [Brevibacillus reuszeri]|uniref:hypothetical protein n=1 Tax=Brevibacillus reuszeri TaxID=54915 RepID=UPI00289F503C|nr:hypothetical protein [Brevibacillus reuszeri]